ncbi:MAG: hypothetical protein WBZ08_25055, partial [Pseudolabrys sp.]
PRPSATGNANIPAMNQPRLESPALRRTVIRDSDRFCIGALDRLDLRYKFLLALLTPNVVLRDHDKGLVSRQGPLNDGQ